MALWHSCGNGFTKISFAKHESNCAALLCCSGPSLSLVEPRYLNGHNRIVFGLNNSYPFINPDIWVGMDEPNGYHSDIYSQPFMKIMRGPHCAMTNRGQPIHDNHNLFYADVKKPEDQFDIFNLRKHDIDFVWNGNTFATALHLALWMGCKNIYLLGCDLDNSEQNYYNSIKLNEKQKSYSQRLYNELREWLKWFSKNCKQHGISLSSCSEGSKINEFMDYVHYLDVVKQCEKSVDKSQPIERHEEAADV